MNKKKILILLLSSHKYPSPRNEYTQQITWIPIANKNNIEVINIIGGYKKTELSGNYLKLSSNDGIMGVTQKTLDSLEWVNENMDYEYVLRVNSSSYINIPNLVNFVNTLDAKDIYCGNILHLRIMDLDFVSGSGILFNKSTISKLIMNKHELDYKVIDDVAIGLLFKKLKIKPIQSNFKEIKDIVFFDNIPDMTFHYRCKLEDYGYPRFFEKYNMIFLHNKIMNFKTKLPKKIIWIVIFKITKSLNIKYYLNKYIFRNRHLRNKIRKYKNNILRSVKNV